ncbi:ABC transporter substrate-binding protein [Tomitella biformata]|uniref:ABC transporter substrate-binding protein n=1 Tax=Tomitella biformata TaxID=630403 RepID=UPI0004676F6A|nr:iron-siderophore ABC transporter substrate-binding protein [Tomitella biformata]
MSRIRSRALAGAAVIAVASLLLTGCGSGTAQDSHSPGNLDVATGGAQFATADTETAKFGSDAAPGEFPRTILHAKGETVIEAKPIRVVVLDSGELDDVLSLGIVPVGIANPGASGAQPTYLADQLEGIPNVGTSAELNIEAIAALQPDLILGSKLRADGLYEQLSGVAPTVFSIRPGFPWKENFLLVADALGAEDQAQSVTDEYQAAVQSVQESLTGTPTISMVRFRPNQIRLYGNKSFIGTILTDVGLPRPAIQDIDELAAEVSAETINEADGDLLFYSSYGPPEGTAETAVTAGPLWGRLGAVESGNAHRVDDETWFLGLGPTGALLVLKDLKEFVG